MKEIANEILLRRFKEKDKKEDKKWINENIKNEIKKRNKLNREKRNSKNKEKEAESRKKWERQKEKVKVMIRNEINDHEIKITNEIKNDYNKGKKIWENINILRGKEKIRKENKFYNEEGKVMEPEEARDKVNKYWGSLAKIHKFEITEKERDEIKQKMQEETNKKMDEEVEYNEEHLSTVMKTENEIAPMKRVVITKEKVRETIKKMKNNKAAGPDGIKPEIFKEIGKSDICTETIAKCFNREIESKNKPSGWKESVTILIPKGVPKPKVKDYRPIALTNMSYKLFMSLIKDEIENHIKRNHLMKENQTGFTKGGRLEDNIFTIQYIAERACRKKEKLILIAVDYSKAYDSIDREKMIETLIEYKIQPEIIDTIIQL